VKVGVRLEYGEKLDHFLTHSAEDYAIKDKSYRKYAQGVDRALVLFETALEEWADYISFLNKLLKV
jgi:hypothetical protein